MYSTGLEARPILVEADIQQGLPRFTIVGLADTAVQEARERVRSAMKNQQLPFPRYAITINLAPSTERKQGSVFDVAIALSILAADGAIPQPARTTAYFGELTLSGTLRPVKNMFICAQEAQRWGITTLVVPKENGPEAIMMTGLNVQTAESLEEICCALRGGYDLPRAQPALKYPTIDDQPLTRWDTLKGVGRAKHALILALISRQHVLMVGSPGCGKTTLAHAVEEILPPLTPEEMPSVTAVTSIAAPVGSVQQLIQKRPWRAPHHSASSASLIGGGNPLRPGEISLAHHGVLFLDELPEFSTEALESLREPMEEGRITINRAHASSTFPAEATIIAAMNPCPCGYKNSSVRNCECSASQLRTYEKRLSGPLRSRFGLNVRVEPEIIQTTTLPSAAELQQHIASCREAFPQAVSSFPLTPLAERLWERLQNNPMLSARDQRHLRASATANALFENRQKIEERDIHIALSYRPSGMQAM